MSKPSALGQSFRSQEGSANSEPRPRKRPAVGKLRVGHKRWRLNEDAPVVEKQRGGDWVVVQLQPAPSSSIIDQTTRNNVIERFVDVESLLKL
jgi:hypothetical protein